MKCNDTRKTKTQIYNCYVMGPTGPTGPTGPASARINVGLTTTAQAGAEAQVYNSGTDNDIILNFIIPQGEMGSTGPTGPQGEQGIPGERGEKGPKGDKGEIGIPGIQGIQGIPGPQGPQGEQGLQGERGETGPQGIPGPQGPQGIQGLQGEKGDQGPVGLPGEKGERGDVGPKGERGEKGEPGPKGDPGVSIATLQAYGGKYNSLVTNIPAIVGAWIQIPIPFAMPNVNIKENDEEYALELEQDGIYEINYFVKISADKDTKITIIVRENGVNIPSSIIINNMIKDVEQTFSGSILASLKADDVIDMAFSITEENVTVDFGNEVTARLTIKKIDEAE